MSSHLTTDPQRELLTQVDKNNQVVGPISRGIAHKSPEIFYRTIYVLVKNHQGQILIQKRSATKDLYPNCWDLSVGGHVNYGDTYEDTAIREIDEELGIKTDMSELKFVGEVLVKLPQSNEFFHVYEFSLKEGEDINFEKKEISQITWMSLEDIKNSIKNKTLNWYHRPEQVINALY